MGQGNRIRIKMSLSTLKPTPDMLLALLDSIRLDMRMCLADRMYQTEEERAGYCKHMAFMAAGAGYRQRLFMAGNRVGKSCLHGTLVATPTGYRPIESLSAGDMVISGDGNPTAVVGVYPQGEVDIYKVFFDGHTSVICCGEHLWKYLPPKSRYPKRHSHGKWQENTSYGKWTVGNTKEIAGFNLSRPKQRPIVPMARPFELTDAELLVDPYVLGVLLGDGGMSCETVRLSNPDAEIIDAVSLHYKMRLLPCSRNGIDYSVRGAITDMKKLGLAGKKSPEKHIPKEYLYSSFEQRLALLRGLMDTDGHAIKNGGAEFTTTSDALCEGFMWLCASLGMKAKRHKRQTRHQCGLGLPSWRVIVRSGDICPFKLKRKVDNWINTKETHDWVVHSIEPCGRGLATCIEVASPCHTYVLEHGIVTHNTEGAGGFELALHLTGRYPDWWRGRRFDRPIVAWAAGDTRETTRDILQRKVIGAKGKLLEGLALVRPALLGDTSAGFIPDSFSGVKVKHISGGYSELIFKSYDQGREAFQGTEVDVILLDEEPPLNVYIECLTRTMTNNGLVMLTFTPLRGMSETVLSFFPENDVQEGVVNGRHVTMAGWDDAPHLTEESKQEMLATYPPFMRLARSRGLPQMGAGVIYPIDQDRYKMEPFEIPSHWQRAYAMDVGWNVTAALFGAWDDSGDTIYVYNEHYAREATPLENSHGIKARGEWIPGVIDPASQGRNQKDGTKLIEDYRGLGLDLTPSANSVEAGILRVWTLLSTGKLKVFSNCTNLLRELRGYIRDEKGRIVKVNDHTCDCLKYLCLSGGDVKRAEHYAKPYRSGGGSRPVFVV